MDISMPSLGKFPTSHPGRLIQVIALALALFATATLGESNLQAGMTGSTQSLQIADVSAKVATSNAKASSGQQLGVTVDFGVAPGWHIYGEPLPPDYTPTKVKFDDNLIESQSLKFPPPTPLRFAALDQTLPVYHGNFQVVGNVVLKPKLDPGNYKLGGTIEFQECNDNMCKMPQSAHFELPLTIAATAPKT
jgi:DsbC/DsbD-like thiol-disulfide interchange protein